MVSLLKKKKNQAEIFLLAFLKQLQIGLNWPGLIAYMGEKKRQWEVGSI